MGGCVSTNHKSSNRFELSRLGQDLFNCYSFDLTPTIDPLTHPTTHTPTHGWVSTHPPMGGGVPTNHKSSNRIELSWLHQDLFNCKSFDLTPPISPLNQPSTHTHTHGLECLYKSSIFKQNWMISIRSRFIQLLVIWPNPTNWPTDPPLDPPNHPHTHPWVGVSLQIIDLRTELNYLD